jgi:hypothetical protein
MGDPGGVWHGSATQGLEAKKYPLVLRQDRWKKDSAIA